MSDDFSLEDKGTFWLAQGVRHLDGVVAVAIDKVRIDGGRRHSQDEFAGVSQRVPSAPLITSVVVELYQNRDGECKNEIEQVKKDVFVPDFSDWLQTSTRLVYSPEGLDVVIHNYKMAGRYDFQGSFVGPNCRFEEGANLEELSEKVLGNRNVKTVGEAYQWANERKRSYVWRLNQKPKQSIERAVVLGRNSDYVGFDIDCGGINVGLACGMVIVESKNVPSETKVVVDRKVFDFFESYKNRDGSPLTEAQKRAVKDIYARFSRLEID